MGEGFVVSLVFFLTVLSIFVDRRVVRSKYLFFLDIPYYLSPLVGAAALVSMGYLDLTQVYTGLTGFSAQGSVMDSSGPFSTIVLFLSVAFVSLCLEVTGFFRYLAVKVLKVVDGSGKVLFFAVFWVSGFLVGTLFSLAFLSMNGFLLWHIGLLWSLVSVTVFVIPDIVEKHREGASIDEMFVYRIYSKMPWEVVPFLAGFFIMVHSFSVSGVTASMNELMFSLAGRSLLETVVGVGVLSTVSANFLNNIPMTVLFSDFLTGYGTGVQNLAALYSLVIGSNIGANITPIGALAGIMWMKMVNHEERRISFRQFFSIGWRTTLITALASLSSLYLIFLTV